MKMEKIKLSLEMRKRLKKVKGILFDLDGTLIDTVELIRQSFRYATQKILGQKIPDEILLRNLGTPLRSQMEVFSKEKADELTRVYQEFNWAHHDELIREYPGTKEVLKRLKEWGYKLAVVTSKSYPLAQKGISAFNLSPFFEVVVTLDDVSEFKPLPGPILAALNRLGFKPSQAIYIGDSPHDIKAGKRAKVLTAAALWGPFSFENLKKEKPDIFLENIGELEEIIKGLKGN